MPRTYVINLPKEQPNIVKFDVEVGQPVQHIFLADKDNLKKVKPGNRLRFRRSKKDVDLAVCEIVDFTTFFIGDKARGGDWLTEEMAISEEKLQERSPKYKGMVLTGGGSEMNMTNFNPLWYSDFYKYFKKVHGHRTKKNGDDEDYWCKSWTEAIMTWMRRVE